MSSSAAGRNLQARKSPTKKKAGHSPTFIPSALAEVTLFDLRVKEVSEPKSEDVVIFQGTEYRIIGEPRRDIHRLIWTVEAVKV